MKTDMIELQGFCQWNASQGWRRKAPRVDDRDIVAIARECLSISSHDFFERISSLSGAADDGPIRVALVRRRPGGVDYVHAVLPSRLSGWLCVCALGRLTPWCARTGLDPHGAIGRIAAFFAASSENGSGETRG